MRKRRWLVTGVLAMAGCAMPSHGVGRVVTHVQPTDHATLQVTSCELRVQKDGTVIVGECLAAEVRRSDAGFDDEVARAPREKQIVTGVLERAGGGVTVVTCVLGKDENRQAKPVECQESVISAGVTPR